MIADKLGKAGWSLGWVSAIDSEGRTIWIVDAHRGKSRFRVLPDTLATLIFNGVFAVALKEGSFIGSLARDAEF